MPSAGVADALLAMLTTASEFERVGADFGGRSATGRASPGSALC
jgi:hypothetical protein